MWSKTQRTEYQGAGEAAGQTEEEVWKAAESQTEKEKLKTGDRDTQTKEGKLKAAIEEGKWKHGKAIESQHQTEEEKWKMAESQTEVEKWKAQWKATGGKVPWQKSEVDSYLKVHIKDLTRGKPEASVLVTWCGKCLDIPWLSNEGYGTVGVELSEVGVFQMFEENDIPYSVTKEGGFSIYEAGDRKMKVYLGDYYELTPELVGTFEGVWDNDAFGAVAVADREKYISVLLSLLAPNGRILLGNWEYGEVVRNSAPFSLSSGLVKELFGEKFDVQFLGKCGKYSKIFCGQFGADWAYRNIHLLSRKSDF